MQLLMSEKKVTHEHRKSYKVQGFIVFFFFFLISPTHPLHLPHHPTPRKHNQLSTMRFASAIVAAAAAAIASAQIVFPFAPEGACVAKCTDVSTPPNQSIALHLSKHFMHHTPLFNYTRLKFISLSRRITLFLFKTGGRQVLLPPLR